jgi:hypothetical protein
MPPFDQNAFLVIPELNEAQIRKTPDDRFSVYDLIEICSGVKNPRDSWDSLCKAYGEVVGKTDNFQFPGQGQRLTPVATLENCLYILGLLPGHCGKSYREKAANLVRRYLEGDANLGADLILREQDKKTQERAVKRVELAIINRELNNTITENHLKHGVIHNEKSEGLYQKSTKDLRQEIDIKKGTPLDFMSTYDLTLNSLASQMFCQAQNKQYGTMLGIGNGLRQLHEMTTGKELSPTWEREKLTPNKSRQLVEEAESPIQQLSLFG